MSLALIEESAKEVRRLAIAGSPLAVGDFRLKKLIAPLEQAGAKVPVFAQVAKSIGDVVNGTEAESAARLLNLSTLLNAILYTQGQTGADGDFQKLETFPANCTTTRTTARMLKPLTAALTTSGGGRFETIKTAVERGAFNDLRLIAPAIQALGDNYPEIADLVAEKMLPAFGPGIIPQLKADLDLKGKKHDARKLAVMHHLDPAGTVNLCKTALEDGSADLKIAAIGCLGEHEDCLPQVLEQTKAKNKEVRAAALEALAEFDRPDITSIFIKIAHSDELVELAGVIRRTPSQVLVDAVLAEGSKAMARALKNESEGVDRFCEVLHCLQHRRDQATADWLLACCKESKRLADPKVPNLVFSTAGVGRQMAEMLYKIGSPRELMAILDWRADLPPDCFQLIVQSAVRVWPPKHVFDEFAPLLQAKKGPGKEKAGALENVMGLSLNRDEWAGVTEEYNQNLGLRALQTAEWDDRWLDAAIKADRHLMVCYLARSNHKKAADYLVKSLADGKLLEARHAIWALARCKHPKVTEVFLDLVSKATTGVKQLNWATSKVFESARYLPTSDLPKLDAFAAKLDEKFVDQFLEAIAPLRAGVPQN